MLLAGRARRRAVVVGGSRRVGLVARTAVPLVRLVLVAGLARGSRAEDPSCSTDFRSSPQRASQACWAAALAALSVIACLAHGGGPWQSAAAPPVVGAVSPAPLPSTALFGLPQSEWAASARWPLSAARTNWPWFLASPHSGPPTRSVPGTSTPTAPRVVWAICCTGAGRAPAVASPVVPTSSPAAKAPVTRSRPNQAGRTGTPARARRWEEATWGSTGLRPRSPRRLTRGSS
jgi:hypothetical protein